MTKSVPHLLVTKLSRLTKAEFSPKNDCGVFFVAPVLGLGPAVVGSASPNKLNSNGSESWAELVPLVLGEVVRFLFVIASNSSRSVDEL